MKKICIVIFFLSFLYHAFAQDEHNDNNEHDHTIKSEYSTGKRDFNTYTLNIVEKQDSTFFKDTLTDNFQLFIPQQKVSFNNLGFADPGNPFITAIYSQQPKENDFWFLNYYYPYIKTHNNVVYFDTRAPYSLFNYTGGAKGLEMLKFLYSRNIGETLNFTLNYDITNNSEGHYMYNVNKIHSLSLSGAYTKRKYQAHINFIFNKINNQENGGINSEENFENTNYRTENIDVNLHNAYVKMSQLGVQYNHEYRFGTYSVDTIITKNDSIINKNLNSKFSVIQDIKFDRFYRVYSDEQEDFYKNSFFDEEKTYDSTVFHLTENRIYANLLLESNGAISKFQILAGVKNKFYYYQNINRISYSDPESYYDTRYAKLYNSHYLSGILNLETSKSSLRGELNYGVAGRNVFDIELNASYNQIIANFLKFDAYFNFERKTPDFFYSFYKSNHFRWDNPDLLKINKTNGGIDFNFNKLRLNIGTNINLIHNYFVFDTTANPIQITSSNLIIDIYVKKLLKLGCFYWFNQLTYQYISDSENVTLPEFTAYSNLYFKKDIFKNAMTFQLGVDFKYHTNIYGYAYMPAIGAFYLQDIKSFGNYPNLGAYVSVKVKRLRAFAKFSNLSSLILPRNYYSLYKIPDNPMAFNFGISWEFYD